MKTKLMLVLAALMISVSAFAQTVGGYPARFTLYITSARPGYIENFIELIVLTISSLYISGRLFQEYGDKEEQPPDHLTNCIVVYATMPKA